MKLTPFLICVIALMAGTAKSETLHPHFHINNDAQTASFLGFHPDVIRAIYRINEIPNRGEGQAIAIIGAFPAPTLLSDVNHFSASFGLPPVNLEIVSLATSARAVRGWDIEAALDVEYAHVIAPSAKILVVQAASNGYFQLRQAIQYAIDRKAKIISMSFGEREDNFTQRDLDVFHMVFLSHPDITFIASTGDNGGAALVQVPAAFPEVHAIGGTSLTYTAEHGLGFPAWGGSGGGNSYYIPTPGYQQSVAQLLGQIFPVRGRMTPDFSLLADPKTGVALYAEGKWLPFAVGGTSLAAPLFAGMVALMNSARKKPVGDMHRQIYSLGRNPLLFDDVVAGCSEDDFSLHLSMCSERAVPGYDEATGWGVPKPNGFFKYFH